MAQGDEASDCHGSGISSRTITLSWADEVELEGGGAVVSVGVMMMMMMTMMTTTTTTRRRRRPSRKQGSVNPARVSPTTPEYSLPLNPLAMGPDAPC